MRIAAAILVGFLALNLSGLAATLIAAGFNFTYEPQPPVLYGGLFAAAVAVSVGAGALRIARVRRVAIVFGAPVALVALFFAAAVVDGFRDLPDGKPSKASLRLIREVRPYPRAESAVRVERTPAHTDMFGEGFLNPPGQSTARGDMLPGDATVEDAVRHYRRAM